MFAVIYVVNIFSINGKLVDYKTSLCPLLDKYTAYLLTKGGEKDFVLLKKR